MTGSEEAKRTLRIERLFDAPREMVWRAWTDPKQVEKWWGPNGFTTKIKKMDVSPGGVWLHTMHGPDGTDYPNEIVFSEVVELERLVYDHAEPPFHVTVTFDDENGKTRLVMQMLFRSEKELANVVKKYKADEGLKQTLGKLQAYLEQLQ